MAHRSKGFGITGERTGMWLAYARGSGVWYWTGRHKIYDTHLDATRQLCGPWKPYKQSDDKLAQCAAVAGIDTLSFRTSQPDSPYFSCVYTIHNTNKSTRCTQYVSVNGTMSTWGLVLVSMSSWQPACLA